MKLIVVFNAKSGSALSKSTLKALFSDASITVEHYLDITRPTSEKYIINYAKRGGIVAVVGGDGTTASVARMVTATKGILAPLPGGTLNHFTKDAGIDQEIQTAILNLKKAKIQYVDTAEVNGLLFLNNSSIGIYPSSLRVRSEIEGTFGKWLSAVIGVVRAFVRFRLYDITVDDVRYKTPFLFVGNNDYEISTSVERHSLSEGILSVYMIASSQRRTLLKLFYAALAGKLDDRSEFVTFKPRQITIHTKKRMQLSVSADGEVYKLTTPLTYISKKKSLKIIGSL